MNPLPKAAPRVVLAVALAAGACSPAPVRHSATAKIGSRLALDARRADALGLTPMASLSTGPARIVDLARSMDEGRPAPPPPGQEEKPADGDRKWFAEVLDRYRPEIEDASEGTEYQRTYLAPLEDARLRWVYVDGPVKFFNEEGRRFHGGNNLYLSSRAAARLGGCFLLTAEPELGYVENQDRGDDPDVTGTFRELTASMRLGPAEVTAGRTPLWWGPGKHGSLLLSNNARSFDLLQVSSAGPQVLPGFLSYLGALRAQLFVTRLEDDRQIPHPYLAGARLTSRVNPWLEIGASRTALFGGKGRPVTLRTLGHVVAADTENDPGAPGNQLASLDARIIVPLKVQPFEVYGEWGGEDEAGGFLSRNAYLLGIYLPRIGPWSLVELTVEHTITTVPGHNQVWYTHPQYPYTYRGDIIGHHVGTDGLDIFGEVRLHPSEWFTPFFSYDYEVHLNRDPVEERLRQFRAGVEARAWRGLWVSAFYGLDRWRNFQQVRGRDETGHAVGLGARWEF